MNNPFAKLGIIVGVVLVAVVGWTVFGQSDAGPEAQKKMYWICTDPRCGEVFTVSVQQLSDNGKHHYGEPTRCPRCGGVAEPAMKCAHCGEVEPARLYGQTCPHCKQPLQGGQTHE
jgi:hypothetical protein